MLKAAYTKYLLKFCRPAITSREVLTEKPTYFIKVWDDSCPEIYGIGECGLFPGLSCDDKPDYEYRLAEVCNSIESFRDGDYREIADYPSIVFGLETAMHDFNNSGRRIIFPGPWPEGRSRLVINGLIWMGSQKEMINRLEEKLASGFRCIKFKVGGIDFDEELEMIRRARELYPSSELEIRLDANGGFSSDNVIERLKRLSEFEIHSIEQPVKPGQWQLLSDVCRNSPIPIALDEELIGINDQSVMVEMLNSVGPAYIILKPSLCGGIAGCEKWIQAANKFGVGWWATSALESNIGLNAIAQWVAIQNVAIPQGLGTGQLYLNNIDSPIRQMGQTLAYDALGEWSIPQMKWN